MKYFQIIDNLEIPNRWFLKSLRTIDGRELNPESFCVAKSVELDEPLIISIRRLGKSLDFTFADFGMPVVSKNVLKILTQISPDSFESSPATIEGFGGYYAVINFLLMHKCVNEKKSEFIKWSEKDGRQDKVGQYRQISKLIIDSSLVQGLDVFRVDGWNVALIVSENIKNIFVKEKVTGVDFIEVVE